MPRVTQHSDPVVAKLERLGLDVQYEPEATRYDAADGLYWFCAKNYVGQGDPLYAILSRLDFHPSGRVCETEGAEDVYMALSDGELDPEELLNWIQGRRSNPSAKRQGKLTIRQVPTRKRPCALCGQPTYVTVQGEPRCADCTTSTGEDAARHALAKNTSRRRKNPKLTALAGGLIYKCPYCKDAIRLEARPGGKCEDCGGPASAVAVWDGDDIENGHPVCAPCAKRWQEYEDPFKHEPGCDGESWARENPTKKPLAVGKRLVVGDKVVMVTQSHDRVGYTVVVMHGDDVQEQGTYAGRTEALKAATLTYETLKHQGRLNPAPPVHFTDRDILLDDIQDYQEGYGPAFGETLLRDAGVPDSDIGAMGELMAQLSPVTRDTLAEALRDQVENASAAQIGQYMREREKLLEE